jgi:hypothetical protein
MGRTPRFFFLLSACALALSQDTQEDSAAPTAEAPVALQPRSASFLTSEPQPYFRVVTKDARSKPASAVRFRPWPPPDISSQQV